MYNMKEREQFSFADYEDERNYTNSAVDNNSNEPKFDMPNNYSYSKPSNYRNDNRYDSAGNMRNSSYQSRENNYRNVNSGQYSSMNRYYGAPQVRNDIANIEDKNRVVAQNQNTAGGVMRRNRVTDSVEYDVYNNKPNTQKKKLSTRAKVCIIVICAVIVLAISLTVANLIPNASAQSAEQARQEVTLDKQVGQVVDEQGNVKDVQLSQSGGNYNYDTKTNWFDGFCDWIENLVG